MHFTSTGAEDDGRLEPQRHPTAANRRQDYFVRRPRQRRQDQLRGVLRSRGQHRRAQKDGRRRLTKRRQEDKTKRNPVFLSALYI